MKFINVGNQVLIKTEEIIGCCPCESLSEKDIQKAIPLGGNMARTAIIMRGGRIYLINVAFKTLIKRLEEEMS